MTDTRAEIVVALEIDDPALRARLTELLTALAGLRLAEPDEAADVALVLPETAADADTALTPREREVLALMAEGSSNKQIAERLGISVHTAKFHVGKVIDKLDASGRTDAVAHAARTGVIHL